MNPVLPIDTDVLSPESVEERIKFSAAVYVTLTQGGRYRVYVAQGGKTVASPRTFDDLEKATQDAANALGFLSLIIANPKKAIEVLIKSMTPQSTPE